MQVNTKQLSIFGMISMTVFLMFMDIKDIFYKITMCGAYPTFSFLLTTPEVVTDYEMVETIRSMNGSWISPVNQWNALALKCDKLFPSKLPPGKPAHLSAMGVGCVLDGVKRPEEIMFVGAHRIDAFFWSAGLLAETIDHVPPVPPPWTSGYYGYYFNIDERLVREQIAALIKDEDIPAIREDIDQMFNAFGARLGLWDKVLCYEQTPMVAPGTKVERVLPLEHGCIHTNVKTNTTVEFHIGPTTGKYMTALSQMVGLGWQALDYLQAGSGIYLRGRMYMRTSYDVEHTSDGQRLFWHFNQTDLGFDGLLYILMMMNEILIVIVNALDVTVVAMMVVRPIIYSTWRGSTYSTVESSKAPSTTTQTSTMSMTSKKQKDQNKDDTLSKMLLYTDLTSVSYRKPLLSTLLVIDAIVAWIYVVPNAYVFAWSSSLYQLGSAYLSMFRVWIIVLIIIDKCWKWFFVRFHEKAAALVTELTYITSFEIMVSTLIGIYLTFNDIMNVSILKGGLVDKQRGFTPTTPWMFSFYTAYSRYSWGDRSHDREALAYIYGPLGSIIKYGILFSFLVLVTRLIATVGWRSYKGTLGGEIETFWRNYQRNSAEVFMDNPLRANALIRSQSMMSYRFGKAVFIRPFVYLEQNYYITRGLFRQRPQIPFLHNEDANAGAEVDTASYMIKGVFRDENSHKLQKKMRVHDVQIPLC